VPPLVRPPPAARLPLGRPLPAAARPTSAVACPPAACAGSARSRPLPGRPWLAGLRPAPPLHAAGRPLARPPNTASLPLPVTLRPVSCGLRRLSMRPAGCSPSHQTQLGRPRRLRSGRCSPASARGSPASSSASLSRARAGHESHATAHAQLCPRGGGGGGRWVEPLEPRVQVNPIHRSILV